MSSFIFTSESVSEGHPDKICDQISDAVLDAHLKRDPEARVACETLATTNRVVLAGEIRSRSLLSHAEVEAIVRNTVREIGYEQDGFHWQNLVVQNYLHEQSADIAVGVDSTASKDEGAGDQGIMFGYACRETPDYMPAPIYYAHCILRRLSEARRKGEVKGLLPDAKSQVSLLYENDKPFRTTSIVVSHQHTESLSQAELHDIVRHYVREVVPEDWLCPDDQFYINPTGRFVIGGPDGDCGLTGRKIIVDTYGGSAPHGGGAFSGKDPTKVDRSAAYIARYLAKNIVAAGIAERCTLQLSYAIGVSKPLSVYLNFHDTTRIKEELVSAKLGTLVDLSPRGIRTKLGMNRPIYQPSAAYGHFGRTPGPNGEFSWEKLDLVEELRAAFL